MRVVLDAVILVLSGWAETSIGGEDGVVGQSGYHPMGVGGEHGNGMWANKGCLTMVYVIGCRPHDQVPIY